MEEDKKESKEVQSETLALVEKANLAADRIERNIATANEIATRWENVMAKAALGGKTTVGGEPMTEKQRIEAESEARVKKLFG